MTGNFHTALRVVAIYPCQHLVMGEAISFLDFDVLGLPCPYLGVVVLIVTDRNLSVGT